MKNLKKFYEDCLEKCISCNIPVDKNKISIKWNKRAKRRWGQCKQHLGQYEITISSRLGQDDCSDKALEETILHELCHATPTGHNHTGDWKRYVNRLNIKYGYNIKRVDSAEDKGLQQVSTVRKVKYRFVCQGCGLEVTRTKKTKFTTHYDWYRCAKCKGKFKPII